MAVATKSGKRKSEDATTGSIKVAKKAKVEKSAPAVQPISAEQTAKPSTRKPRAKSANGVTGSAVAAGKNAKSTKTEEDEIALGSSSGEEDFAADQAAALLAGFESDSDSQEEDEVLEGIALDQIPDAPIGKSERTKLAKAKQNNADQPGTVYVGRVPHGFYEHQMRSYFSQFGNVTKLRLSRNKKTGASKHYAFIEFDSADVADIVARTMNKYLMFGHILQVKVIPQDQVHPDLWKGANSRYKVVPRRDMEGRRLKGPKDRAEWEKKVEKERKKREGLKKKLQGMDYEFDVPDVKSIQEVQVREQLSMNLEGDEDQSVAEEVGEDGAVALLEAPAEPAVVASSPPSKKTSKTTKKAKSTQSETTNRQSETTKSQAKDLATPSALVQPSKSKKRASMEAKPEEKVVKKVKTAKSGGKRTNA